jgi:hypothetical protein
VSALTRMPKAARLRPLKRGAYKVTCGRPGCTVVLGVAERARLGGMTVNDMQVYLARELAGRPTRSNWTLHADERTATGFYRRQDDPESTYRMMANTRVEGRRALPTALQSGASLMTGGRARGIIGQFPALPTTIICHCGTPNSVAVPESVISSI